MILILVGTVLWSAEYQKLTFSDGTVKVGYFDERKATLTLDDGSTIAIKVDDVIRREPASPAKKPLVIPPPVKNPTEEKSSPEKN
jgi:hypothetical protein